METDMSKMNKNGIELEIKAENRTFYKTKLEHLENELSQLRCNFKKEQCMPKCENNQSMETLIEINPTIMNDGKMFVLMCCMTLYVVTKVLPFLRNILLSVL
ncbi:unnamed protein product [Schistosoma curassoni]|uniref:Uncharacterized protein n=1 Tax=Schistosoma curassoni TaxID=6186 RepID=A0A183JQH2_9TREM|nr:unnamed protein product [Schistosoma curassoni]